MNLEPELPQPNKFYRISNGPFWAIYQCTNIDARNYRYLTLVKSNVKDWKDNCIIQSKLSPLSSQEEKVLKLELL